jgi:glutamyl-Q tRNA(Asp) synthetase
VTGFRTRFAPSPTGFLHLGHAFSALTAWHLAHRHGGSCVLRLEDTDAARVRSECDAAIREDLHWLGLAWPEPVLRQSEHLPRYEASLDALGRLGVTYPCACTRAEIRAALSAPQEGAPAAPAVYPGTCRGRSLDTRRPGDAIRLDMGRAFELIGCTAVRFTETGPVFEGSHLATSDRLRAEIGDVVLGRKDIGVAYHLSVVVDDAFQGISHVVRGADLFEATPLHRLLQRLLGLPEPVWHHHRLIRDAAGRRLAKRDDARAIRTLRDEGATPGEIRASFGFD